MSVLRDTQRWLASLILEPERLEARGAELTDTLEVPDLETALTRVRAYSGGYPVRLGEALAETFPTVEHIIGKSAFAELVARYKPDVPMATYSLSDVGARLARFLGTDVLADRLPFLPDLAETEWRVQRAFHARRLPAFDASVVSDWTLEDWQAVVLVFQPDVAVVRSRWPVVDLWHTRDTAREEIDVELEDRPQSVMVTRVGYKVACETVDDDEARALEPLLAGTPLGDAMATLAAGGGDAASVTRWFSGWMQRGLVADCRRPES